MNAPKKKILVLGAGLLHQATIRRIQRGGFLVVAADGNPAAPGLAVADVGVALDITDAQAVADLARREGVQGVMPVSELAVSAASHAAHALGLPGAPPDKVAAMVDKAHMRRAWAKAGLCQPAFVVAADLDQARRAMAELGAPCVIKPDLSGGAGRGVLVLTDASQLPAAFSHGMRFARGGHVVLEGFMSGVESTIEGLVQGGKPLILAMSDKEKPPLTSRVATSLNYPADFDPATTAQVAETVLAAVAALGFRDGAFHCEVIVGPHGVGLVEIAARGGGGHVFSTIAELVSGVNYPAAVAEILCGGEPDLPQRPLRRGACYRFMAAPASGVLAAVDGLERARGLAGVVDAGLLKDVGDRVGSLLNSMERVGYLVTSGDDRQQALDAAGRAEAMIKLTVTPDAEPGQFPVGAFAEPGYQTMVGRRGK